MAGEAKTTAFMLGTATIMLGALADLMTLNDANSIGLVKNVTVKTTPGFTDLTQGVKNSLVYSVMTSNDVAISGEVYEYTGKNLSYAAGLDGTTVSPGGLVTATTTALAAPVGPATEGVVKDIVLADIGTLAAGDYMFVQLAGTENIVVRKAVTVTAGTKTVTMDRGLPFAAPIGTVVKKVNAIAMGSTADQPYLSAKIVGTMANGDQVVVLIPKVRITSGMSVGFKTDNFDNMPLELKVYDQVAADPFYNDFQKVGPSQKPAKAMMLASS